MACILHYTLTISYQEGVLAMRSCIWYLVPSSIYVALERYRARVLPAAIPNWTLSGHLRGCSMADTHIKSLTSGIYPSILSYPSTLGH
eukprot:scaffold8949_cov126-Skeletonema_marinoi.AAC.16